MQMKSIKIRGCYSLTDTIRRRYGIKPRLSVGVRVSTFIIRRRQQSTARGFYDDYDDERTIEHPASMEHR